MTQTIVKQHVRTFNKKIGKIGTETYFSQQPTALSLKNAKTQDLDPQITDSPPAGHPWKKEEKKKVSVPI